MLSNLHAASCCHQCGGGGNIEAVGVVATGAHDFKDIHASFAFGGVVTHGSSAASDFISGFGGSALSGKSCQKSRILRGSGLTAHYLVNYCIGLVIGQILFSYDFYNCFLNHVYLSLIKNSNFYIFQLDQCPAFFTG